MRPSADSKRPRTALSIPKSTLNKKMAEQQGTHTNPSISPLAKPLECKICNLKFHTASARYGHTKAHHHKPTILCRLHHGGQPCDQLFHTCAKRNSHAYKFMMKAPVVTDSGTSKRKAEAVYQEEEPKALSAPVVQQQPKTAPQDELQSFIKQRGSLGLQSVFMLESEPSRLL